MCGVLGIVGDRSAYSHRLVSALERLSHRGPDGQGTWSDDRCWLGHRRLAIIDLSSAGAQPMCFIDSGLVITFNGEIYNYIELRDELARLGHHFRSRSDTEVLLHAFVEWGPDSLARLNGMWAFAIWDPRTGRCFLARDRLGVKPLYYACRKGSLLFASEPKALIELDPNCGTVDDSTVFDLLAGGRLHQGERTFFSDVRALRPGHWATFSPGNAAAAVSRYWSVPADEALNPGEDVQFEFDRLLTDSTRLRLRSDVRVGLTLSGGLDSSAILSAAARFVPDIRAYTSTYDSPAGEPEDERRWARAVVKEFPSASLTEVGAAKEDWLKALEAITWHMDGPGYSPAVFPLWEIMKRARSDGTPVLLEGQGADELLGGYSHHAAIALLDRLRAKWWRPDLAASELRSLSRTFGALSVVLFMLRQVFPWATPAFRWRYGALGTLREDFVSAHGDQPYGIRQPMTLNEQLTSDLSSAILPGLLQYGDAISMAHSVESRLPFLDYRLVEFVSRLPATHKVAQGESKRILRSFLRSHGLSFVADRQDKLGYPTPVYRWIAEDDGLIARELLTDPGAAIHHYCSRRGIEALTARAKAGNAVAQHHLYRLISTEVWLGQVKRRKAPSVS